jgi:ribosomal protein S18 acetylase RimI-like enzyme
MEFAIRPLTSGDEAVLWDMLYVALLTSEGGPEREVVQQPELARYVEGWGRADDIGFVAHGRESDHTLGAVWMRTFSPNEPPHLAFSVRPQMRRRGIGAALLTQLVKATPERSELVIHVPTKNPVVRLYERFGFHIVDQTEDRVRLRRQG